VRIRKVVLRAALAVAASAVATAAIASSLSALPFRHGLAADPPSVADVAFGAYVGPAKKGVEALPAWQAFAGTDAKYALDFAAADTWANVTGPDWALSPWRNAARRLIYSVPMFPHQPTDEAAESGATLARCAAGNFDTYWTVLGENLVSHRLPTTIVRPGWEFDASWYVWAANGRQQDYVRCFQRIVTAMRTVPGQHFQFLWNPSVSLHEFPAEEAYPGNAYVDYVGVDVYDTSWAVDTYPYPAGATAAQRQAIAAVVWNNLLNGPRGLRYWSAFAGTHGKRMAIPEWGLSDRSDGRGGGDNVAFIEGMLAFIRDMRNDVAFAMYFDSNTVAGDYHRISSPDTRFPQAAAAYQRVMASLQ
jgi:hypothetical protein